MEDQTAHLISSVLGALRAGGTLIIAGRHDNSILSIEACTPDLNVPKQKRLVLSRWLADSLGLSSTPGQAVQIGDAGAPVLSPELASALVSMLKLAQLVPCCLIRELESSPFEPGVEINQAAVLTVEQLLSLSRISSTLVHKGQAQMATNWAPEINLHLFSEMWDSAREHLAAVWRDVRQTGQAPLVRVHSKCVTGDIFDSLRCDCGEQLERAKQAIRVSQSGILIYLDQEGRGIGLQNKFAAYKLQDEGFDTFAANHQLGFEADERCYDTAVQILEHLGVHKIRLLTNNPDKVAQLSSRIEITERVPLLTTDAPQRQAYLSAKKESGHIL